MARPALQWRTDHGIRYIAHGIRYTTAAATRDALLAAAAAANTNTARQVTALAEVHARGVAPAERQRMNHALGKMGQASVLRSYDRSVTARQNKLGNTYPYRATSHKKYRRYAGGRLRGALAAESFFEATADHLVFINETALNKAAVQWARLNAGAGGRAGPRPGPTAVRWSNVVVGVLGIDMGPRPGFFVPKGYWFSRAEGAMVSASEGERGRHEFHPIGVGPLSGRTRIERKVKGGDPKGPGLARRRPSKGIRGRHFLEAGTERIAEAYPSQLEALYRNLWAQGVVGPTDSTAIVKGPRARRLKASTFRA